MESPPILLLTHRRADLAQRVLQAVARVRPRRLFIAADGPRPGVPGEAEHCRGTIISASARKSWPATGTMNGFGAWPARTN